VKLINIGGDHGCHLISPMPALPFLPFSSPQEFLAKKYPWETSNVSLQVCRLNFIGSFFRSEIVQCSVCVDFPTLNAPFRG